MKIVEILKGGDPYFLDICFGFSQGKLWFPLGCPEIMIESVPGTFLLDAQRLAAAKMLLAKDEGSVLKGVENLQTLADPLLEMPALNVVQKPSVPEGVGLHDYFSVPSKLSEGPEGNPPTYSEVGGNLQSYASLPDSTRLQMYAKAALILSVAAYITGNPKYSEKASSFIHVWHLEPQTRQTPNFQFAHATPGNEGKEFLGLMEGWPLVLICESLQLLRSCDSISGDGFTQCTRWFIDLLDWFETSDRGLMAQKTRSANSRFTFWLSLQRLIYARFCGQHHIGDRVSQYFIVPNIIEEIYSHQTEHRFFEIDNGDDAIKSSLLNMIQLRGIMFIAEERGRVLRSIEDQLKKEIRLHHRSRVGFKREKTELEKRETQLQKGLTARLEKAETELNQSREDSVALKAELNQSREDSVALKAELNQSREDNAALEAELNQTRVELNKTCYKVDIIQSKLHKVNEKKYELSRKLANREKELSKTKINYNSVLTEKIQYKCRYKRIKNSRTWRYTSPLRRASKSVKAVLACFTARK